MGIMADKAKIPHAKTKGDEIITLPALSTAKIELYRAMQAEGVGKAALARRLDVALPHIDRLLDLRHHSRLDMMERAFSALGRSLDIIIHQAAA